MSETGKKPDNVIDLSRRRRAFAQRFPGQKKAPPKGTQASRNKLWNVVQVGIFLVLVYYLAKSCQG